MLVIKNWINQKIVGIASREDSDQTAFQKQSDLGLHCLSRPFLHAADYNLRSSTIPGAHYRHVFMHLDDNITATNPSPSSHIPVVLNFLFPNFEEKKKEIGQCYSMRHSLNFSTLMILVLRGYSAWQLKFFCNEEKLHFFNFNTYSRISLCAKRHFFMYVEGKHQGDWIAFSDF